MLDWLTNYIHSWGFTWPQVLFALGFSVVTFFGSLAVVTVVLVKLPANYFHSSHAREFLTHRHPVLRMIGIVVKNIFGLVLVGAGVVMSLPGVPGQGVLTILLGIMLLDFPGKRNLEAGIVRRPRVFQAINGVRARFDKPPLYLD
ncbi:MAG TPA: hypothetical protein VGX48_09205 [Pyrinomonadaceae bacterium]|jgi:hypothetical protein|nr:hypothetical protein [Pyrinomonadaceae bacterium]